MGDNYSVNAYQLFEFLVPREREMYSIEGRMFESQSEIFGIKDWKKAKVLSMLEAVRKMLIIGDWKVMSSVIKDKDLGILE